MASIAAVATSHSSSATTNNNNNSTNGNANSSASTTGPAAWPHADHDLLSEQGLTYDVTYCGSVEVLRPMKDLDFQSRTVLARECIDRIYGALYPSLPPRKKSASAASFQHLTQFVGNSPDVSYGNTPVTVSVNIDRLLISNRNTAEKLASFQLSLVSFASKGDDDVSSCVAFVAKDAEQGRACHVLIAPSVIVAKELIGTLGQAFDLKFSRLVAQRNKIVAHAGDFLQGQQQQPQIGAPDGPAALPVVMSSSMNSSAASLVNTSGRREQALPHQQLQQQQDHSAFAREYVNDSLGSNASAFNETSASHPLVDHTNSSGNQQRLEKQGVFGQPWFHGFIDREESESRLVHFGDFLIRESGHSPGQFVLSGRTELFGVKHLLLIDPDGNVRTKDRQFLSIAHLVQHHLSSGTPIISQDVEIFLRHPVSVSSFVK